MQHFNYVIIGNSVAAIGAVEAIRELDDAGSLAVISDEPHHVYARPLISYYLAGEVDEAQMSYRPADFYEQHSVQTFLGRPVDKVDFRGKALTLADGTAITWDKLLLAVGGTPFVPPIAGGDKQGIYNFTTLAHARAIKERLPETERVVVLGGGLIGLKAAEALHEVGVAVTVVELAERVLSPVLDPPASRIVEEIMAEHGVEIITGHTIAEFAGRDDDPARVGAVVLDDGQRREADLAIIAIGVRPRLELTKGSPIKVNRGLIVDRHMQTSVMDVYAAGDVAEAYDFIVDTNRLVPIWPNAYMGGRVAGQNMAGERTEYNWGTGMNAVDFFAYPIVSAGLLAPPEGVEGYEVLQRTGPSPSPSTEHPWLPPQDAPPIIYRKLILRHNRVKGMILAGEVDQAGIILGLMRDGTDASPFKDKLLANGFGLLDLPRELRDRKLGARS